MFFKSTPPSGPNKAGLDVCPSIRTYIRPSVCPQKVSPVQMKFHMYLEVIE